MTRWRYVLAILLTALASVLRWQYPQVFAETPYLAYYPAVVLAAVAGGVRPGLLATFLSFLCVDLLFDATPGRITVQDPVVLSRFAVFVLGGTLTSVSAGMLRAARAAEARRTAEAEQLNELVDESHMFVRDEHDRIIRWTTGCERLYGFTREQALGRVSHELLNTEFPQPLEEMRVSLRRQRRWQGELVHVRSDGSRLILASLWILRDRPSGPVIMEINNDITDRKRAEEEAERGHAQLLATFQAMTDGVMVFNMAGEVVLLNDAEARLCQHSSAQEMKRDLAYFTKTFELLQLDGTPLAAEQWPIMRALHGKSLSDIELRVRRRDSGKQWIMSFSGQPVRDAQGRQILAVIITRDITGPKQAQEALARSERRLRSFFESEMVGTIFWNIDGRIIDANDKFLSMVGYSREDLQAHRMDWASMTPPEYRQLDEFALNELKSRGVDTPYEKQFIRKDGTRIPIIIGAAMLDERRFEGVAFVLDITSRKQAEESLRQSEERFRVAQELSPDGFTILHPQRDEQGHVSDFVFVYENAAIGRMNGTNPKEVVGRRLLEVFPNHAASPFHQLYVQVAQSGEPRVLEAPYADESVPTRTWFRTAVVRLGEDIAILAQDITERKHYEQTLRRSEQRLLATFDHAGVGITEMDRDDRLIAVNDRFCQVMGYTREQLLGRTVHELTHPDDRVVTRKLNSELHEGRRRRLNYEKRYVRSDGTSIWVNVTVSAVCDDQGSWLRSIAVIEDITARKKAEEQLMTAKAAAESASLAKDHFLAVLSHELRTPLTPVVATLSMLHDRTDLDEATRHSLQMIHRNVNLEARLIDDLLDVTRIARGKVELDRRPVDLADVLEQAIEVVKPDIEARRIHFGVDAERVPFILNADCTRLQQVFWNLLRNAIKFTPHDGCVGIRIRREPQDNGSFVVVEVRDSGEGIEPAALDRIFNAFEQAERSITRQFGGLGLGLTISKALVEMHGGSISAHSEGKGQGASFAVRLPLTAQQNIAPSPAPSAPQAATTAQRRKLAILLVEDHGDTASVLRQLLLRDGHDVELAGDVASALELTGRRSFDLLISDLGLPDSSGLELLQELRCRGRSMPAIALSGYGQEQDVERSRAAGFAFHLTKPVTPAQLTHAINDLQPQPG